MSHRSLAYSIAALVLALDRVTKVIVGHYLSAWDTHAIIPGFLNFIYTENPGAAFSAFSGEHFGWSTMVLIVLSAVAAVLISVLLWRDSGRAGESRIMRFGLALILGGALGNEYDRIVHGAVIDFIEVYVRSFHWPAFNVADSAISAGACLVLIDLMLASREPQKA
jgi:signal peptidase II